MSSVSYTPFSAIYVQDWTNTVHSFVEGHAPLFSNMEIGQEFTVGHFHVFQEFHSLADALLETVLEDLGCPVERFAKICDEVLDDDTTKNKHVSSMLDLVLTFNDFTEFSTMMIQKYGRRSGLAIYI